MKTPETRNSKCDSCAIKGACRQQHQGEAPCPADPAGHNLCHSIMVMSGKGGVGKSSFSANLGAVLASRGARVGILDADIHGPNIPRMLGVGDRRLEAGPSGLKPVEAMENLKVVSMALLSSDADRPIVWRGPAKHNLIRQFAQKVDWGYLDLLIVDLPPGTGDEPLSVAKLVGKMEGSVVVTTPQEVAILDSRKAVVFSRMLNIPVLGIVENMSGMTCPHCGGRIDLFRTGGGEKAALELGVPFLGRIPIDPEMVELCDAGKPLALYRPNSPVRAAYLELASRIFDQLARIADNSG